MNQKFSTFILLFVLPGSYTYAQNESDSINYWQPRVIGDHNTRGVEISYEGNGNYDITSESEPYGDSHGEVVRDRVFEVNAHFPVYLKPNLNIAGAFEYSDEKFHFSGENQSYPLYQSLNEKNLKSIGGKLYVSVKLKHNSSFLFRFRGALKGDYGKQHIGDVGRSAFLKMEASTIIGWKISPYKSWGVGLAMNYTFGDPLIVPVLRYNNSFTPKWGVEADLPAQVRLRYRPGELWFINAHARLNGGSYSIHFDDPELDQFKTLELRRSDVNFSLEAERGINQWLWVTAEFGYRVNINFDVTNKNHKFSVAGRRLSNRESIIDSSAKSGVYYTFSTYIAPKAFYKKVVEPMID
jgi:hypothetical protein